MAGLIPDTIHAGATFDAAVTLPAYPAPEWTLQLILRGPGQIDLASIDDGEGHRITASPAVTSGWTAGAYWWALRATDGAAVHQVAEGELRVVADLALVDSAFDGRSHAQRVLAAIEAVIEGRATTDQQAYTIAGRSLQRMPIADLLVLRSRYRDEVRRQQQARAGQSLLGRQIKVRF